MQQSRTGILCLLLSFVLVIQVNAQSIQWLNYIGGSSNDISNDLTTDNAGNVYIVGSYRNSVSFGVGNLLPSVGGSDVVWARYSTEGNLTGVGVFGTGYDEEGHGIHVDESGFVYVTGIQYDFEGPNIFLAKFNSDGSLIWSIKEIVLGSSGSVGLGWGVGTDSNGNVYIVGHYQGTAYFNDGAPNNIELSSIAGNADVFIAKYSSSGAVQWAKSGGGVFNDIGTDILVTDNGDCFITGWFNNNCQIAGTTLSSPIGNEMFIAKYNSSGVGQWANTNGGSGNEEPGAIAINNSGTLFVGSSITNGGNPVGIVSQFNSFLGTNEGSVQIPNIDIVAISNIQSGDEYAIAGSNGANNMVVKKISGNTLEWTFLPESSDQSIARGIELNDDGRVYASGFFNGNFVSGDYNLNSIGGSDIFITELSPSSYCSSGAQSNDYGAITSVNIGGQINNNSFNCTGYSDFSDQIAGVYPGQTIDFSITVSTCAASNFNKALKVFVDWNADNDFDDIGEEVAVSPVFAAGTLNGALQIPTDATLDVVTRFRIVCINMLTNDTSQDEPADIQACGDYFAGETEDYSISVLSIPSPQVLNIEPATEYILRPVTLIGENFFESTVSQVAFNGIPVVSFNVVDNNTITAIPDIGTKDGPVSITTLDGQVYQSTENFIPLCAPDEIVDVESGNLIDSWFLVNLDQSTTMVVEDLNGLSGSTKSLYVDNHGYDAIGQLDGILIANQCLPNTGPYYLSFDIAYTYFSDGIDQRLDSLMLIDISDLSIIWRSGGDDLATAPGQEAAFIPQESDWRTNIIDLSSLISMGKSEVDLLLVNINGHGNNLYLDNISFSSSSLLFVENVSMQLSFTTNHVHINWQSINEIDNSHFVLERSDDGVKFEVLTQVESKGDGDYNYYYVDDEPLAGLSYYRISSVDIVGDERVHEIASITTDIRETISNLKIYPNPVNDYCFLSNSSQDEISVDLYNSTGQYIKHFTVPREQQIQIKTDNLQPGLYLLSTTNGYDSKSQKLVITR